MLSQLVLHILNSFLYLLIYSLIQLRDFYGLAGDKTIIKMWFPVSRSWQCTGETRHVNRCQEDKFCAWADPQIILFTNEKKREENNLLKVTQLDTWSIKAKMQAFWLLSHCILTTFPVSFLYSSGSQKDLVLVSKLQHTGTSENLLEMQILGFHPKLLSLKFWKQGPETYISVNPPGDSSALSSENPCTVSVLLILLCAQDSSGVLFKRWILIR